MSYFQSAMKTWFHFIHIYLNSTIWLWSLCISEIYYFRLWLKADTYFIIFITTEFVSLPGEAEWECLADITVATTGTATTSMQEQEQEQELQGFRPPPSRRPPTYPRPPPTISTGAVTPTSFAASSPPICTYTPT